MSADDQAGVREEIEVLARTVIKEEAVPLWMSTPVPDLGGSTPSELIEAGEGHRVADLLIANAEGVVL